MKEEHYDLFERRMREGMLAAEREAFDARLLADTAFAQDFAAFVQAWHVAHLAGEAALRKRLQSVHQAMDEPQAKVFRMRPWAWLSVAASLLAAIGITWFLYDSERSSSELLAEHLIAFPAPEGVRGEAESLVAWSRFGEAYARSAYDSALVILEAVDDAQAPAYLRSFYRGQCELHRPGGDARTAIAHFEVVLASDNDLHAIARWHLALAALKAGDAGRARLELTALARDGSYKRNEAQELLRALPSAQTPQQRRREHQ
ncbi:MAG: hypothetical protein IPM46_01410 [Flavobacteriales bacterium]|nr:hypothetical protein [Flavobacteriales bacterium]